jgi:phosphohistidine phosphatase
VKIYLLRHGLADRSQWNGPDHLRPLTPHGKARMAKEAQTINALQLGLTRILTSPLTRAYQTAEIVAQALDMQDALLEDERLGFGFGLQILSRILEPFSESEAVMLVGHEPSFSHTISQVIGGGAVVCKKGSLARLDLYSMNPPRGELVWLLPPKVLAAELS